ncbi:MAG: hypothetical protein ACOC31_01735 [Bacteroidota bacterium]
MKRLSIIIIILLSLNISSRAQVSGSLGNRFVVSTGVTTDILGSWIPGGEFTTGIKAEMNYILTRSIAIGVMGNFNKFSEDYENISTGYDFPYAYNNNVKNKTFDVSSNLIELYVKGYGNGQIAPLGSYTKFSMGLLSAGHAFDINRYRNYLYPTGQNPVDDARVIVEDTYRSFFLGFGVGESYPIADNLFIDFAMDLRLFFKENFYIKAITGSDFDESDIPNNYNMLEKAVLQKATLQKTVNISVSLKYAF